MTFVGAVERDENLFRETKSGDSAGGNQAISTIEVTMSDLIQLAVILS